MVANQRFLMSIIYNRRSYFVKLFDCFTKLLDQFTGEILLNDLNRLEKSGVDINKRGFN